MSPAIAASLRSGCSAESPAIAAAEHGGLTKNHQRSGPDLGLALLGEGETKALGSAQGSGTGFEAGDTELALL